MITGKKVFITGGAGFIGSIVRNTRWNFLGFAFPIVVALFAIPALINGLGAQRFGVLAMGWAVMGYFALFDFGIGKATTKFVSEFGAEKDTKQLANLVWNAIYLHLALGLVSGLVFAAIAPWLDHNVFKIPPALQGQTLGSFYWLAASVPVIVATSCLRSVLEALQRFDLVNLVKIPISAMNYLAPLVILYFTTDLVVVIAVISLNRILGLVAYLWLCLIHFPEFKSGFRLNPRLVKLLVGYGGWVTVSSLVVPSIVFADRFFIAGLFSLEAVTYYATPYEVVTKLWIFSASLLGALFPVFSALSLTHTKEIDEVSQRATHYLLFVVAPLVGLILTLGREALLLWVGEPFAVQSTAVAKWLAVGVLINVLAQVPFTVLQAVGRPQVVARLQLLQLPFYLLLTWYLVNHYGSVGAAMAWTIRALADGLLLQFAVNKMLSGASKWKETREDIRKGGVVLLFLASAWAIDSLWRFSFFTKLPLFLALMGVFLVWEWRVLLNTYERYRILAWLGYGLPADGRRHVI